MLFTMLNCKVLHQNLKIISTIYLLLHPSTKIQVKIIMKNIKRKIENIPSDYVKEIFQESNIFSSQRQPKNLRRVIYEENSSISRNPSLPTPLHIFVSFILTYIYRRGLSVYYVTTKDLYLLFV